VFFYIKKKSLTLSLYLVIHSCCKTIDRAKTFSVLQPLSAMTNDSGDKDLLMANKIVIIKSD